MEGWADRRKGGSGYRPPGAWHAPRHFTVIGRGGLEETVRRNHKRPETHERESAEKTSGKDFSHKKAQKAQEKGPGAQDDMQVGFTLRLPTSLRSLLLAPCSVPSVSRGFKK